MKKRALLITLCLVGAAFCGFTQGTPELMDAFGGWIEIGLPGTEYAQNPGNRAHTTSTSDGYGAVEYTYYIAKQAVSVGDWKIFFDSAHTGRAGSFNDQYDARAQTYGDAAPAINISFHQAAQYANWLTTGNARDGAYTIDASGKVTGIMSRDDILASGKTYYVLPTLNEWFKAAYFNQKTKTYHRFSYGGETEPPHASNPEYTGAGWNYRNNSFSPVYPNPWPYVFPVGYGEEEVNGTLNMVGNVFEWIEDPTGRQMGGSWVTTRGSLEAERAGDPYANRHLLDPTTENVEYGLRIAAIPDKGRVGVFILIGEP